MSATAALPVVTVADRAAARARAGHPWIWRPDVVNLPAGLAAGPVLVRDRSGRVVGAALYATRSPVALRLLGGGEDAPAFGAPLLETRLQAALSRRRTMLGPEVDAFRVAHAEADELPGLVVDRYGECVVVQMGCEALDAQAELVLEAVRRVLSPETLVLRDDGSMRDFEGLPRRPPRLVTGASARARFHEGAVAFEMDALADAKTGAFLDQRENHLCAGVYGHGARRVLDAFTYHGGFALQLLSAGAGRALAIDESATAIERARANADRAGFGERLEVRRGDAFEALRALEAAGERFEVVVLDPPALAKRRGSLAQALRAYRELNLRALRLLEPEGILVTASCSGRVSAEDFGRMLGEASAAAGRPLQILEKRGAGRDHPERAGLPETAYLKCWICRALGRTRR